MQEALPINFSGSREVQLAYRNIARGLRWIVLGLWKPIRWLLEAIFTPHPGQQYIEENRLKAIRMVGHF